MPILLIWGNDTNSCEKEIDKFISKNASKVWGYLNVSKLNGDDPNQVFKALEEMQMPPMGDGSRIIVLKNNPIFNSSTDIFSERFQINALNMPNSTYLVLSNTKKPDSRKKTSKFLKTLIKNGQATEFSFNLPDFWDNESQIEYVINTCNSYNIQLKRNVAILIIEAIGIDSIRLNNELQKTILYLTAKNKNSQSDPNNKFVLTKDIVEKIFNDHQSNIFKISDLLIDRKIHQSLIEINNLLNKGEPPLRLTAALISQLRMNTIILLQLKEKDLSKISKLAGLTNPKRIFFIRRKVQNSSPDFLINILIQLLNIESLIKKGNNPINVFTENLATLK